MPPYGRNHMTEALFQAKTMKIMLNDTEASISVANLVTWRLRNDIYQSSYWVLTISGRWKNICSTEIEIARIITKYSKDGKFLCFCPCISLLFDEFEINGLVYVFNDNKLSDKSTNLSKLMKSIENKIKLK